MGTQFVQQNRSNTMISFKGVEESKAILRIWSKHPERHAPEEFDALRRAVHDEERFVLLERFDQLWSRSYRPVLQWESTATGRPRLVEGPRTDLRCWMETAGKLAESYKDQFHVAHLLQVADGRNRELRALNLRYLYLDLLRNPRRHIDAGYIDAHGGYTGTLDPVLEHIAAHRLLRRHLEPGSGELRSLRSLPVDADERAGTLGLYMLYLDFGLLRVATDPDLRRGTAHLSHYHGMDSIRETENPVGYLDAEVAKLGSRLDELTRASDDDNTRSDGA